MNLTWSSQAFKGLLLLMLLLQPAFSIVNKNPEFYRDSQDLATTDPKVAIRDVNAGSHWSTTLSTIKSVSAFGITATGCVWRASKSLFVNWIAPVLYWAGQKVVAVAVLAGKTVYTTYNSIMRARREGLVGVPVRDCGDGIFCATDEASDLAFILRKEYLTFNRLVLRMLVYESNEDPPQLYYVQQLEERSRPEAYHVHEYFSRLHPLSATIDRTGKKTLVVMDAIGNFLGHLTVGALRHFRTRYREASNNLPSPKGQNYHFNQLSPEPTPTKEISAHKPPSSKIQEHELINPTCQAASSVAAPGLSKLSPRSSQDTTKRGESKRQPPRDQRKPRPDVSSNRQPSMSTSKNSPRFRIVKDESSINRAKDKSSIKRIKQVSPIKRVKQASPIKRAQDASLATTRASKEGYNSSEKHPAKRPDRLPVKHSAKLPGKHSAKLPGKHSAKLPGKHSAISLEANAASQGQKTKPKAQTSKPTAVSKRLRSQPDSSLPKTVLSTVTTYKNGSRVKRPVSN